jgi:Flp pilus assembly protein TadG
MRYSVGTSPRARRLARESGGILAMVAIMLPVLIGITALAVDLGNVYDARNRMAAAADAAARAGAFELQFGAELDAIQKFGKDASKQACFE